MNMSMHEWKILSMFGLVLVLAFSLVLAAHVTTPRSRRRTHHR